MTLQIVAASEVIVLRGGLCVSLEALRLGWRLEEQGLEMRIEDDTLIVRPKQLLTERDITELKRHRADLKRLVASTSEPL